MAQATYKIAKKAKPPASAASGAPASAASTAEVAAGGCCNDSVKGSTIASSEPASVQGTIESGRQVDPDLVKWLAGHGNIDPALKTEILKCCAQSGSRLWNFQTKADDFETYPVKELRSDIVDLTGMSKGAADAFAMCLSKDARSKAATQAAHDPTAV